MLSIKQVNYNRPKIKEWVEKDRESAKKHGATKYKVKCIEPHKGRIMAFGIYYFDNQDREVCGRIIDLGKYGSLTSYKRGFRIWGQYELTHKLITDFIPL